MKTRKLILFTLSRRYIKVINMYFLIPRSYNEQIVIKIKDYR